MRERVELLAKRAALLAAAGALSCVAPHGPAIPAVPSRGGPAWVELSSPHFVVWTDASAARGRALVQEMEHHRQVVLGVAFADAPTRGKGLVIALRDEEEVGAYVPKQFRAYAWGTPNLAWQPVIVIDANTPEEHRHIYTHELTHVISWGALPNQPKWFAEGLAGYFETARVSPAEQRVDVGEPLDYIVGRLRTQHATPAAALFACAVPACMDDMFYATTWAVFSWLANEHPKELLAYMQRLVELPPDRAAEAWRDVFPSLTPDRVDHELAAWLAHGRHAILKFSVKIVDVPIAERALTDGDALAARALLDTGFGGAAPGAANARSDLAAALAADPTNLLARLVEGHLDHHAGSIAAARAVAAAHPNDWRAWWLLGAAVQYGPELKEIREKMCALAQATQDADRPARLCERR